MASCPRCNFVKADICHMFYLCPKMMQVWQKVQNTNDCSTVSKVSAASLGYFHDEFQKFFINRKCRRSPLIHRGYYIRFQAITFCIGKFLHDIKSCNHKQIISLGCGYDSLYFRLRGEASCATDLCVWEVDFPPVVQRKHQIIQQNQILRDQLGTCETVVSDGPMVLSAQSYKLLGVDLNDVSCLDYALDGAGLKWDCPSLILAEVALCYMDPARSTDIIGWAAARFPNARFILYEQICPEDPFGQVMMGHFVTLNSPLRSVEAYPLLHDQRQRFLQQDKCPCLCQPTRRVFIQRWHRMGNNPDLVIRAADKGGSVVVMNKTDFIKEAHRQLHNAQDYRVLSTDPTTIFKKKLENLIDDGIEAGFLDEETSIYLLFLISFQPLAHSHCSLPSLLSFQEFHLKCSHYFILVASRGSVADVDALPCLPAENPGLQVSSPMTGTSLSVSPLSLKLGSLRRFGHRSCLLSTQLIITTGGFGVNNVKHQRLTNIHLLRREMDIWDKEETADGWDGRLLHSLTPLSMFGGILVLGGRFSPTSPALDSLTLKHNEETGKIIVKHTALGFHLQRWRHSATEVFLCGLSYVFVFGGRSLSSLALQDTMFLCPEDLQQVQVQVQGSPPSGRHSHSCCTWNEGAVLSGGLLSTGVPSGSIYFLRPCSSFFQWVSLDTVPQLTPRYSHTSHILHDKLIIVGGVWIHRHSVPGIAIIDLSSGHSAEYQINTTRLEWPLMLHGHSSILLPEEKQIMVLGGGGNCFSFGTHLNQQPVVIHLPPAI
ncbi:tRNA wybutosine-synthesizing protein 4 [Bombina bombina]|uniref:tRNA wybutosine-synthesizing protein 4 n=1 Tax=Bombina bombina TaxID=8345 RepID=UPI00235B2E18|nr:tRNA wybutosine-synthesizing protein 4 [Bombina bombina]